MGLAEGGERAWAAMNNLAWLLATESAEPGAAETAADAARRAGETELAERIGERAREYREKAGRRILPRAKPRGE